jgi:hypothetical protein
MKTSNTSLWFGVLGFTLLLAGCNQQSGGSAPPSPGTATAPAAEKMVYAGELELSKSAPVQMTVEDTNECTVTTMVLPGGTLNLDIAITPKGGATTHASVTTRNGQQFTFQVGNTTVGYTAKLKAE